MERVLPAHAEIVRVARECAARLSSDERVELVYLFGSSVDGTRPSPRDVDLALFTRVPLSLEDLTRLRADLVNAAGLPIDLVPLNGASGALAYEVVETGRCLYARSHDVETEFVTRTRSRYWDFAPYRAQQWRLTGQRIAERLGGAEA